MPLAFQSRARINRRCRDKEVLLHLFFKHHKRQAKFKRRAAAHGRNFNIRSEN